MVQAAINPINCLFSVTSPIPESMVNTLKEIKKSI